MIVEYCDLCKENEPNRRFKVKMSKKGFYGCTEKSIRWIDSWGSYKKIEICDECCEKLFGIKSQKTIIREICEAHKKIKENKNNDIRPT